MCVPTDSFTHYLFFYTVRLHCQTPILMPACTIFIIVFGVTRQGSEPTTYCIRGRNANHKATLMRYIFYNVILIKRLQIDSSHKLLSRIQFLVIVFHSFIWCVCRIKMYILCKLTEIHGELIVFFQL